MVVQVLPIMACCAKGSLFAFARCALPAWPEPPQPGWKEVDDGAQPNARLVTGVVKETKASNIQQSGREITSPATISVSFEAIGTLVVEGDAEHDARYRHR